MDHTHRRRRLERLRIGYLCGDFREHPTSRLIAGLIEAHDRSRFEVRAYSTGPDDGSPIRQRLRTAFDAFIDLSRMDDDEAARAIHEQQVDVLVDLNGWTDFNRAGLLARRPAPVCAHYLGYPGPIGAPWIDYFVADSTVLPRDQDPLYDCAIARLPNSYQVTDPGPQPSSTSRDAVGLPRDAVVLCGFAQPVKLSPEVFDVWINILKNVPAGVLWLLEDNRYIAGNLRAEAQQRGIDTRRLVFAPRVDHASHMARLSLADLMLETWPCGAHTTASDALWAAVPFVTRPGRTLASRVGTSLLHALGMPELVVTTAADYEALVIELGRFVERRAAVRGKLVARKAASALFHTKSFCKHIEGAYQAMWQRFAAGHAPASFDVGQL